MSGRLAAAIFIFVLACACARPGFKVYRNAGLRAEIPGSFYFTESQFGDPIQLLSASADNPGESGKPDIMIEVDHMLGSPDRETIFDLSQGETEARKQALRKDKAFMQDDPKWIKLPAGDAVQISWIATGDAGIPLKTEVLRLQTASGWLEIIFRGTPSACAHYQGGLAHFLQTLSYSPSPVKSA